MTAPGAPLAALRVVVTRAERQAGGLEALLEEAGARVARLPLLELAPAADPEPLARAAASLERYDWVVLTSANAVEALAAAVAGGWPERCRLAAIGGATAAALARHGLAPALVPARGQAEGLLEDLAPHLAPGARVLLPQAADARPVLAAGLRALGAELDAVEAYRKRLPAEAPQRFAALFAHDPFGWVTFTSPSTARRFAELAGPSWPRRRTELRAASIGPVTSAALRALGVEPAVEAATPDEGALVAAIRAVGGRAAAPHRPR